MFGERVVRYLFVFLRSVGERPLLGCLIKGQEEHQCYKTLNHKMKWSKSAVTKISRVLLGLLGKFDASNRRLNGHLVEYALVFEWF